MSRNFTSAYGGDSVSDSVRSMRVRKQVEMQSKSRVSALLDEIGGVSVGEDVHTAEPITWYQKRIRWIKNTDNFEGHEDTFKKAY